MRLKLWSAFCYYNNSFENINFWFSDFNCFNIGWQPPIEILDNFHRRKTFVSKFEGKVSKYTFQDQNHVLKTDIICLSSWGQPFSSSNHAFLYWHTNLWHENEAFITSPNALKQFFRENLRKLVGGRWSTGRFL